LINEEIEGIAAVWDGTLWQAMFSNALNLARADGGKSGNAQSEPPAVWH